MSLKNHRLLVFVGPAAVLAGCAGTPDPVVGIVAPRPDAALGQDMLVAPYRNDTIGQGDVLSVTVFREPDLSNGAMLVGPTGFISVPLIGTVQAEGRALREIERDISARLAAQYLVDPRVSLNLVSQLPRQVTVEGAVTQPGVFTYRRDTRLSGAIAQAGGPNRVAKVAQVAVFRADGDAMTVALFDYGAIRQGTMIDPVLHPGDRIVVGTSGLSQAWQDALRAIPALALFTQI